MDLQNSILYANKQTRQCRAWRVLVVSWSEEAASPLGIDINMEEAVCDCMFLWRKVKSEIYRRYLPPFHFGTARAKRLSNKYHSATKGKTVTEC